MNPTDNGSATPGTRPARWRPWAVWGVGALFFCYAFFHRVTPSAMFSDIMREFGIGGAVLGNLSAFYFYAYAGLQVVVGLTVDRIGPRRVMTVAALACAAGSLICGIAPDMLTEYSGRLLVGAGAGFALIGTFKLAANWFPPERFALLTGLTASLGTWGAAVGQAPMAAATAAFGWRSTLVAAAGAGVLIAVLIWIIARDVPPTATRSEPSEPSTPEPRHGATVGVWRTIGLVLATPHNWAFALILGSMTAPLLAFAGLWGVPFLMESFGISRTTAAATTTLYLIGHGIGSASMGWVSDRIRRRKLPLACGAVVTFAMVSTVIYVPGLPLLATQALLLIGGIASGAALINFAMTREHNRPEVSGTAMGFVNLLNMGASALFQPLLGWFLDLGWQGRMVDGARVYSVETFRIAFLAIIAMGAAGVIASLLVRETYCRPLAERTAK